MEKSANNRTSNQRYNFIKVPEFNNKYKSSNNDFNYLSQSQSLQKNSNINPLSNSIADKIKLMKEELKKEDKNRYNNNNKNNDFKLRLERITKREYKINNENKNQNNLLIQSQKDLDLKMMKNKLKLFETRREKDKNQKKNAFDELDNILNNFKNKNNNRYGD